MLNINAVFASDSLCRDNTRFTPGALVYGLRGVWKRGTPSFLSHDFHRPIGWTAPRAVYLEPGLSRLCGTIVIADRNEDSPALRSRVLGFLQARVEERAAEFEILISELGDALKGDRDRVAAECIAVWEPGLAERRFPRLFQLRDDDGLVPLAELDAIAPGVYRVGELAVFAHRYFRRGLSPFNTLNGAFLRTLQELPGEVRPRVALDPDMVGLARTYQWQLEHQYWWGPRFSDDLGRIPTGVSVHQATDEERLFHGISRTEFWWQSRKEEHILEVEEIRNDATFALREGTSFGCRYAHSIVTEASGELLHFDGAVRSYTEEQMIERLDVDLPRTGRDKEYTKLWRIDGHTELPTWKRLLSDYFRDNHLVGEYLGADSQAVEELEAERAADPHEKPAVSRADALVPVQAGGGPRISLSFCPVPANDADRTIVPLRAHKDVRGEEPFVEMATVDLVKALRRAGREIELDSKLPFQEADDLYYNLPMVWHRAPDDVAATVEALRSLAGAWLARGIDGALSFTVAYPLEGEGFVISVRGHVADIDRLLSRWPQRAQPHLSSPSGLADALYEILEEWPATHDEHAVFDSAFGSGHLDFGRLYLDPNEVSVQVDPEVGIKGELMLDSWADPKLADLVTCGRLKMIPVWRLTDPGCMRCKGRYRLCSCSSLLDEAVVAMDGAQLAGVVLTDRPA